jgi:uncharacterized membrane protein YqjE
MKTDEKLIPLKVALRILGIDLQNVDLRVILAVIELLEEKKGTATLNEILEIAEKIAKEEKK